MVLNKCIGRFFYCATNATSNKCIQNFTFNYFYLVWILARKLEGKRSFGRLRSRRDLDCINIDGIDEIHLAQVVSIIRLLIKFPICRQELSCLSEKEGLRFLQQFTCPWMSLHVDWMFVPEVWGGILFRKSGNSLPLYVPEVLSFPLLRSQEALCFVELVIYRRMASDLRRHRLACITQFRKNAFTRWSLSQL